MDDRKRRLSGSSASDRSGEQPGPAAKRPALDLQERQPSDSNIKTTTVDASASQPAAPEENQNLLTEERIHLFQKQAIFVQMQEYKRIAERNQDRVRLLESQAQAVDKKVALVESQWVELLNYMGNLVNRFSYLGVNDFQDPSPSSDDQQSLLQTLIRSDASMRQVEEDMATRTKKAKGLLSKLCELADASTQRSEEFNKLLQNGSVDESVKSEIERLKTQTLSMRKLIDEEQTRNVNLNQELQTMRGNVSIIELRAKDLAAQLDVVSERLLKAEKERDKARVHAAEAASKIDPSQKSVSLQQGKGDAVEQQRIAEIDQLKDILNLRLKEIETHQDDKVTMIQEIDRLKLQATNISEEKIMDSPAYRQLNNQCNFLRAEVEKYRDEASRMFFMITDLHNSRRKFLDNVESITSERIQAADSRAQHYAHELSITKSDRDHLQHLVEGLSAKMKAAEATIADLKAARASLSEERDHYLRRIDLLRKLWKMESNRTNDAVPVVIEGLTAAQEREFLVVRDRLNLAEMRVKELNLMLDVHYEVQSEKRELEQLIVSEQSAIKHLNEAVGKIEYLEKALELFKYTDDSASEQERLEAMRKLEMLNLGERARVYAARCEELEKAIEIQPHEEEYLADIDTLDKALTEQRALAEKLSKQLLDKDDVNTKLLSEKVRLETLNKLLIKERDEMKSSQEILKKQAAVAMDLVKKCESKEKNLQHQLGLLEKESATKGQLAEVSKAKAISESSRSMELELLVQGHTAKMKEVQSMLDTKSEEIEREVFRRRRQQEETLEIRKRLEQASKFENQGDEVLREEIQAMKRLLKCGTCQQNERDTVIKKCWHIMCKNCATERIQSRNRRCPTCNLSFAREDIQTVYF